MACRSRPSCSTCSRTGPSRAWAATRRSSADVRIVAATNRELRALVERGEFREDLYYRLCVVNIRVPALRDRPDEIPVLIRQFLDPYALRDQRPRPRPSAETMERLLRHRWPGNVRELENVIRQIVLLGEDARLLDGLLMVSPLAGRGRRATPPRSAAAAPGCRALRCGGAGLAVVAERARQGAERQAIERALSARAGGARRRRACSRSATAPSAPDAGVTAWAPGFAWEPTDAALPPLRRARDDPRAGDVGEHRARS